MKFQLGPDILIVEFQAYIVFAIYRMIFEANIAQISLSSVNIAIYRDICLIERYLCDICCKNDAIGSEASCVHNTLYDRYGVAHLAPPVR